MSPVSLGDKKKGETSGKNGEKLDIWMLSCGWGVVLMDRALCVVIERYTHKDHEWLLTLLWFLSLSLKQASETML